MNIFNFKGLMRSIGVLLNKPLATPETDPLGFFGSLQVLPDPDPILRSRGRAEQIYNSMIRDPHIVGDVRSIRGNFRSYSYRLLIGDESDPASVAAHQTCEQWMLRTVPSGKTGAGVQCDWLDVMWQMTSSILYGYRVHEAVWGLVDGLYLPTEVIVRPSRRIQFDAHGSPLLISKTAPMGEPVDPMLFVISRHMADSVNPYGIALLSACFWVWTFKTGGWKYFVKYCERHGLPWPVARYPLGTSDADQDKLAEALANMIEAGYLVMPEGNSVELLVPTTNAGGTLPQQNLIDQCNREISKALTGQAMVAELNKVGARAASETAADRQSAINASDRDIAVAGMGQLFRWITLYNHGDGVAPPTIEFFHHEKAGTDRAETYEVAVRLGARPSKSALLEELGIPEAESDEDTLRIEAPATPAILGPDGKPLPPTRTKRPPDPTQQPNRLDLSGVPGFEFARAAGMTEDEAIALATDAADRAIEDHMIAPVAAMLARYEAEGKTLAEFHADLSALVGEMDDAALREVTERSLQYAILRGAATRLA